MALLMGAAMALVMFAFMRSRMYRNRTLNLVVVGLAFALGGTALYLSRSQALVDDQAYMRAMIPHHSIAILTSERADIDDLRVRELANSIAAAQRKEIEEMNWLIEDIERNGPATTEAEARQRPVPDLEGQAAGLEGRSSWRRRSVCSASRRMKPRRAGITSVSHLSADPQTPPPEKVGATHGPSRPRCGPGRGRSLAIFRVAGLRDQALDAESLRSPTT